ncbi:MAG: FlgD immunoglobulin-like domain containing protein [Planctomycetia bacterium]
MQRLLIAITILTGFSTPALAAAPIRYSLDAPGRVSLALYDQNGIQVRTLRNAEPQPAGPHEIAWDGLDQDGQPLPPGTYTWKLLEGQGLKAEYLFSLGINTRDQPWPGNHDGPNAISVEGDEVCVLAGAAEGGAGLVCMNRSGTIDMGSGSAGEDLARVGEVIYVASEEHGTIGRSKMLSIRSAKTGEQAWWTREHGPPTVMTVKEVKKPVATTVTGNRHLFRYDVPSTSPGGWNWYLGRITLKNVADAARTVKLFKGISRGAPQPFRDVTLKPAESVTVDLDAVVVSWDAEGQFVVGVEGEPGWEVERIEMLSSADRVAAAPGEPAPAGQKPAHAEQPWIVTNNQVCIGSRRAELIQLIEPRYDGKVLREMRVPGFQDLAFTRDGRLLVISGGDVCEARVRGLKPVIKGLDDPRRLTVDAATGDIFVAEWGDHHQIRRYGKDYAFKQAFGREGGRRYGPYERDDFYRVSDVAGDGEGGFYVTENWGARRTAHFDAQGKCVREWFGGQNFFPAFSQDTRHPDRFWLMGTFNTDLIECEVDWAKRDWRVRTVYNIHDELVQTLGGLLYLPHGYVDGAPKSLYRDLDGDGKPERLLWIEGQAGMLLRVDEAASRVIPLAAAGFLQDAEVRMLQDGKATDTQQKRYAALLEAFAKHPRTGVTPRYWTWADADGDGRMQTAELRLFTGDYNNGTYVGGMFTGLQMDEELTVWQRSGWGMPAGGPSWYVMKPEGYTACGAPIWRYDTRTRSTASDAIVHALVDPDGSSYELRITTGEGYYVPGVQRVGGHGLGWPSTMHDGTQVLSRAPDGTIRWRSGHHAALEANGPAQLHSPVRIAGILKGCVGVADRVGNPLAVWTTDGLYVGDLFDRKANDGQPGIAYAWGQYKGPVSDAASVRGATGHGIPFDRFALTQYDMLSNGILSVSPAGEVFYTTTGANNAPFYRVTGWGELKRQQGEIVIKEASVKPAETGVGLSATWFSKPDFQGDPTRLTDGQIWFGGTLSATKKAWPLPAITGGPCSAVWEGTIQPRFTEPGRLLVYLDLGRQDPKLPPPQRMRLWVNGKLELDSWDKRGFDEAHLPTRWLDWKAGERVAVKLEYSCDKPSDELGLCWESPSLPVQHIPAACLHPAKDKP